MLEKCFSVSDDKLEMLRSRLAEFNREQQNVGPKHGVRFLLNTKMIESAELDLFHHGHGFEVYIHDGQRLSFLSGLTPIKMSPGFSYSVSLSTTFYSRYVLSGSVGCEFDVEDCFLNCFYTIVYKMCGCWLLEAVIDGRAHKLYKLSNNSYSRPCDDRSVDDMLCRKNVAASLFLKPFTSCPSCKTPCFETVYDHKTSIIKFPSHHMAKMLAKEMNTVVENVGKNHLMVNFYFEPTDTMLVVESVSFTLHDLFHFIGHWSRVIMGLSFTFIIELVFYVLISICCAAQLDPSYQLRRKARNDTPGDVPLEDVPSTSKTGEKIIDTLEDIETPTPMSSKMIEVSQKDNIPTSSSETTTVGLDKNLNSILNEAITYV